LKDGQTTQRPKEEGQNPLDKFTVGDLTRLVADILGDPHFVSQMSKMMSKQVAVNLGKSIEATCLKCIEPLTHKIEKQSKLIDVYNVSLMI
jgi:hypothetical protein